MGEDFGVSNARLPFLLLADPIWNSQLFLKHHIFLCATMNPNDDNGLKTSETVSQVQVNDFFYKNSRIMATSQQ